MSCNRNQTSNINKSTIDRIAPYFLGAFGTAAVFAMLYASTADLDYYNTKKDMPTITSTTTTTLPAESDFMSAQRNKLSQLETK